MNALYSTRRRLTAVVAGLLALGATAPASAQGKVIPVASGGPTSNSAIAACATGSAEATLDINNVRAVLYNIGGLFWRGSGAQYEVPAGSGLNSIFASGIWVGGQVDGQLRFAGSTYGEWEYWPGPLGADGTTTTETCGQFDRFWKVEIGDIRAYNATGTATSDLQGWPIAYGAPFFIDTNGNGRRDARLDEDGDGVPDEPRIELNLNDAGYGTRQLNLEAGERPDIIGDQGIWWVMNDEGAGAPHAWSEAETIRLEVRAQAFAFSRADALNNATFYRYQFFYRGSQPMTDTYLGIFSDPDLGEFNDDYVGSDPDLGLGFVYNGDDFDDGGAGYGAVPPALGYDFFQGPLVNSDGIDNDDDGEIDEDDERLAIEKFFYFTNGGSGPTVDPNNGDEAYSYMQGFWKDGTPLRQGADGYNTNGPVVDFAFPGNPPEFWSEYNSDGNGTANTPADRRFGVSSGPFTFNPGDMQEIVFGIVWSQASGTPTQPQIASVRQLKVDNATLQSAFDAEFALPQPPPAVDVTAAGLDQQIILEFDSETGDIADIFRYDEENPFAPVDAEDRTYSFEGFRIFQYRSEADNEGTLIRQFDIVNGITVVTDVATDPITGAQITQVVNNGADNAGATTTPTAISILQDAFTQQPLRNGTSYYFGVQAYAINEASVGAKVFSAPVTRVEVRPSRVGPVTPVASLTDAFEGVASDANVGGGEVNVRVVNPAAITGDSYEVRFFEQTDADGTVVGPSYDIVNATTGEVLFNGRQFYTDQGVTAPQSTDVFRAQGLAFDIQGPENDFTNFTVTQNAAGPINPPTGGSADFAGFPVPERPGASQQSTQDDVWFIGAGGASGSGAAYFESFKQRSVFTRAAANIPAVFPFDFEFRFTGTSTAYQRFNDGSLVEIPFEIWNTGIGTPDDTSDDFRMVPAILDIDDNGEYNISSFGPGDESSISGADNDPFTDWVYWYEPNDKSPGEAGYQAWLANAASAPDDHGQEALARTVFVSWNGGVEPPFANQFPEQGSIFRIETSKPNQPGDVFSVSTAEVAAIDASARTADDIERDLDLIAITPNPYRGVSGYEASGNATITRFVNLPAQATIRIYTLSGTLIRTIEKANTGATIDWDLRTEASLPVASGIYLIHVEAREADGSVLGERVLKFGVIQRRTQLDVL
ncbi:hypothetical protein [Rubrivirga sp.]|uniref:hypothetical protein n=1 Tax=Rubrivirga sp. TaxID=1885344 RepID=UPI003C71344B